MLQGVRPSKSGIDVGDHPPITPMRAADDEVSDIFVLFLHSLLGFDSSVSHLMFLSFLSCGGVDSWAGRACGCTI